MNRSRSKKELFPQTHLPSCSLNPAGGNMIKFIPQAESGCFVFRLHSSWFLEARHSLTVCRTNLRALLLSVECHWLNSSWSFQLCFFEAKKCLILPYRLEKIINQATFISSKYLMFVLSARLDNLYWYKEILLAVIYCHFYSVKLFL